MLWSVYMSLKPHLLSHSQLPFRRRAGAKALSPLGPCSQGKGHDWLCCSCCSQAGLHVCSGLQVGPQPGLDLTTPGMALCADRGSSLQAVICATAVSLLSCWAQPWGRPALEEPVMQLPICSVSIHLSWLLREPLLESTSRKRWEEMGSVGSCRHLPHRLRTWFRKHWGSDPFVHVW